MDASLAVSLVRASVCNARALYNFKCVPVVNVIAHTRVVFVVLRWWCQGLVPSFRFFPMHNVPIGTLDPLLGMADVDAGISRGWSRQDEENWPFLRLPLPVVFNAH